MVNTTIFAAYLLVNFISAIYNHAELIVVRHGVKNLFYYERLQVTNYPGIWLSVVLERDIIPFRFFRFAVLVD